MTEKQELIARRLARGLAPNGATMAEVIGKLLDLNTVQGTAKRSRAWVEAAIRAVRAAADPNPWKESTDEEIAAEIMRRVRARGRRPEKE